MRRIRGRKNFNPVGLKEFFDILSKLNMPKDLVRNEERWKQAEMGSTRDVGLDFLHALLPVTTLTQTARKFR